MLHAVSRNEIVDRRRSYDPFNQSVHSGPVPVDQEHRTGLRSKLQQVTRTVVLLVGPRVLVLPDDAVLISSTEKHPARPTCVRMPMRSR